MKLAKLLVSELEALGMEDIILRENAIITATLLQILTKQSPSFPFWTSGHQCRTDSRYKSATITL